jgi:predicted metal-dependent hydrolase
LSLNRNLVFLPERLSALVVLHELCHLRELHHGSAFWELLASHCPDLAERRSALRCAWRHVPLWAR